jgi:hypothetical protein
MVWVPSPRLEILLRNSRSGSSTALPFFSRPRTCRKNQSRNRAPIATYSHTGEMEPFGISTVFPMVKSCREAPKP